MLAERQIIRTIAGASGLRQDDVESVLDYLIGLMQSELAAGRAFRLPGFGAFRVVPHGGRRIRNPRTGEIMEIPPGRRVRFTPSSTLKKLIAGGGS